MANYHSETMDDTLSELTESVLREVNSTTSRRNPKKKKEDKAKAVATRRALEKHFERKRWQRQYGGIEHYSSL
ncbi:hypothetical protein AVI51_06320 [Piscirickettsia salmonis]|uniref:Uncharacterized protein n=2 Tax=Piscirickettsia salmonis TaxID=1238 RepID=A0A9Q5V841_PISSA|nr:hypothetical protein [Piscirickettsia salmonis]ALA25706.1 hypothetical protein KW89_2240 [Piscirickettsia salmonis]APS43196.1 hypothetical protein AVI48_01550 [Piscirickettsia salmonis]APS46544.1 hypothetical protein AVI49_02150 [Piscirickettsia salmonis]APS50513.1 hypothetical protein AVI50_06390 [Piscirickettsia salmonis]APS53716.1 hypothetical protein AVI51_06320 [Piscirickettsia salmonis]